MVSGQDIQYSTVLGEKLETTAFQILPITDTGVLIYKKHLNDHYTDYYNSEFKIEDEEHLDWIPFPCLSVSVIPLHRTAVVLIQCQHGDSLLCEAAVINSKGHVLKQPYVFWKYKIEPNVLNPSLFDVKWSENRKFILLYKSQSHPDTKKMALNCLVLDDSAHLVSVAESWIPMEDELERMEEFQIDDRGNIYALHVSEMEGFNAAVHSLEIGFKPIHDSLFYFIKPVETPTYLAKNPYLVLDNLHQQLYVYDWYLDDKGRHILGLFVASGALGNPASLHVQPCAVSPEWLGDSSGKRWSVSSILQDLEFRDCLFLNSNNQLLVTELVSPVTPAKSQYESIYIFRLGPSGEPNRVIKIFKYQGPEISDGFNSFFIMNSGNRLRFLYNKTYKSGGFLPEPLYLPTDTQLDTRDELAEIPLFRNLDRKHHWLLRYGIQTHLNQAIFPCLYGSNLIFAQLTFNGGTN